MIVKRNISGNNLKIIALVTMLIDHIGSIIIYPLYMNACFVNGVGLMGDSMPDKAKILYQIYVLLRFIGRIAFPIFAFMLTEGFIHTKNLKKYFIRMFLFAIISEIPYDIANSNSIFNPYSQNVLWTFVMAMVLMIILKNYIFKIKNKNICKVATFLMILLFAFITMYCDGGLGGILLIASMYIFKNNKVTYWICSVISIFIMAFNSSPLQLFAITSLLLIELYNGKTTNKNKYIFYIFYPAHLLILSLIYFAISNFK